MAPLKVLVADDDPNVHEIIRIYFEQHQIELIEAFDGKEALDLTAKLSPDMVILDVMMPEMDGYDTCKELNKSTDIPIIMLTSKREEIDCILGLELGADDYMTKPFSPRELISRMKAIFRRVHAKQAAHKADKEDWVIEISDLKIHPARREVLVNGELLTLRPKEFELLTYMAKSPGHVFTRDHLLEHVWGYDYMGDARTVDVHIKKIRKKLAEYDRNFIVTVWGVGYKLERDIG